MCMKGLHINFVRPLHQIVSQPTFTVSLLAASSIALKPDFLLVWATLLRASGRPLDRFAHQHSSQSYLGAALVLYSSCILASALQLSSREPESGGEPGLTRTFAALSISPPKVLRGLDGTSLGSPGPPRPQHVSEPPRKG